MQDRRGCRVRRFLAVLGAQRPNALFFAGDLGQRIFQQPYSWKGLGIDVRGRSRTLRVNYRTSHQIRRHADRLLESELTDIDGNKEKRSDTISVFNGPLPMVRTETNPAAESKAVGDWMADKATNWGLVPHEFGVFVRSEAELERAKAAVKHAGYEFKILDEHVETVSGFVSVGTMHRSFSKSSGRGHLRKPGKRKQLPAIPGFLVFFTG